MHRALAAMLTETILHTPYVSQDAYGKPVYGASRVYPARIEYQVRRVVDSTGQEKVSRSRVFLDGAVTIGLRDQILLPDGSSTPILTLYSPREVDGSIAHHEVNL
jgi:hypothetical protein